MRRVPLKRIAEGNTDWAKLLVIVLRNPIPVEEGQASMSSHEGMTGNPIAEKIESAEIPKVGSGEVLLEEAEHKWLSDRLHAWRWLAWTPELHDMIVSVTYAPEVAVTAVPDQAAN